MTTVARTASSVAAVVRHTIPGDTHRWLLAGNPWRRNAMEIVGRLPLPFVCVVCQKGRSSEPRVVSPAVWLPEFDS